MAEPKRTSSLRNEIQQGGWVTRGGISFKCKKKNGPVKERILGGGSRIHEAVWWHTKENESEEKMSLYQSIRADTRTTPAQAKRNKGGPEKPRKKWLERGGA